MPKNYPNFIEDGDQEAIDRRYALRQESFLKVLEKISLLFGNRVPREIAEIGAGAGYHTLDSLRFFANSHHTAFEPAPDMKAQLNKTLEAEEGVHVVQSSIEDIDLSIYKDFFDLTYTLMVMHFSSDLDNYLKQIHSIGALNSLHLIVEAVLPSTISGSNEKLAFQEYCKSVMGFHCSPLSLAELAVKFSEKGFEVVEFPESQTELLSDESAISRLNSIFPDQRQKIDEISMSYSILPHWFFRHTFIEIFILKKI